MGRRGRLPAGVRKRFDKSGKFKNYEMRFTVNGERYTVTGETVEELSKRAATKKEEIEKGLYTTNKKITVDELFQEWKEEKSSVRKSSSLYVYSSAFNVHISPALGKYKVTELERRQIIQFLRKVMSSSGDGRANTCRDILFRLFKYATDNEIIARNIVEGINRFKNTQNTKVPARDTIHRELTDKEIGLFFQYAAHSLYYNAMRFMLNTGVRAGECLALQWKDVQGGTIHIDKTITRTERGNRVGNSPKTKTSRRIIPINNTIREIINEQRDLYRNTHEYFDLSDFVFPNSTGGFSYPDTINTVIDRTLKAMKRDGIHIAHFSSHSFRATFASRAARHGVPPNTLKEIMGHANMAITMDLYAHINDQDKINAMNIIEFPIEKTKGYIHSVI